MRSRLAPIYLPRDIKFDIEKILVKLSRLAF